MPDPYLRPGDLRTHPDLASESRFSDALLEGLVAEFELVAERYRGVAYTIREAVETHHVERPTRCLVLGHRKVRSVDLVEVDGEPRSVNVQVDRPAGVVNFIGCTLHAGFWTVTYQHGHETPPAAVLRACRLFVWREAMAQANPNTANTFLTSNTELGIVERASTADWGAGRPTGWMDVDRILNGLEDLRGGDLA